MKPKKQEDPTEAQRVAFGRLQDAGQAMICLVTAKDYARKAGLGGLEEDIAGAINEAATGLKIRAEEHLKALSEEVKAKPYDHA